MATINSWNNTVPSATTSFNSGPTINPAGMYTNSKQPAFFVFMANTVPNVTGDGTAYQVVFDTVLHDNTTMYNTGNGEFVTPADGFYMVNATVGLTNVTVTNQYGYLTLWNNTASSLSLFAEWNPASQITNPFGNCQLTMSGALWLPAATAFSIFVQVNDTTAVVGVLGVPSFYFTSFGVVFMG